DAETLNPSDAHTAAVEQHVLAKARQQTPGQVRAARPAARCRPPTPQPPQHRAQRARGRGCLGLRCCSRCA
ncbi:MAG: hypothetical protein ACRDST_17145, partial [Pseudonocardiaceae bacterium]